jgi:hypothetical protein
MFTKNDPKYGNNFPIWSKFDPGMTLCLVTTCCFAMNFEEIVSLFVLNVFLWLFSIIKMLKLGSYLHNTYVCGHFCQNWGI